MGDLRQKKFLNFKKFVGQTAKTENSSKSHLRPKTFLTSSFFWPFYHWIWKKHLKIFKTTNFWSAVFPYLATIQFLDFQPFLGFKSFLGCKNAFKKSRKSPFNDQSSWSNIKTVLWSLGRLNRSFSDQTRGYKSNQTQA